MATLRKPLQLDPYSLAKQTAGGASPDKKFGDRGKSEGPMEKVEALARKLRICDYYTRRYAALDLRDIAKKGVDIEPARHLLVEMRDYDAAPNCRNAAKEALDAADAVNNQPYDEWEGGKEAICSKEPYHAVLINGREVELLQVLKHARNTAKRKALNKIEEIARKGIAGENISVRLNAVGQLKKIAEDKAVLDNLNVNARLNLRKALENISNDSDPSIKTLAGLGLKALDAKR